MTRKFPLCWGATFHAIYAGFITCVRRLCTSSKFKGNLRSRVSPGLVKCFNSFLQLCFTALSQNVIDHYENPKNVGVLDKKASNVGTGLWTEFRFRLVSIVIVFLYVGLVGAPACGDVMKLQIKVGENGVIEEAVFKVFLHVVQFIIISENWFFNSRLSDAAQR